YATLSFAEVAAFKIGKKPVIEYAQDNAVLFLWITSPMLHLFQPIVEAWGFEYKASFVWDKVAHNMGHYNSVRHELLLICTRGSCPKDSDTLIDSVQTIDREKIHSRKPEEFYGIIEGMYTHGRKLELFPRGARKGWDGFGYEMVREAA